MALAEQSLADLRAARSVWGERIWTVVLALVSALIGGAIARLFKP